MANAPAISLSVAPALAAAAACTLYLCRDAVLERQRANAMELVLAALADGMNGVTVPSDALPVWEETNALDGPLLTEDANSGYQLFTKIGEKYGVVCIPAAGKDNIKQKILLLKSEKVLVIADGAAFGPQMNDIYRLMQEDNAKFSLYLPESLEWLLLKADLLGQPDILEILQHPADFIESSEFFSWERFFTNLLEQRTKDISYMRYDKAKLPEFYLQEENLEKIIAEMG